MKILFITTEGFDTPSPNNQMAETMIKSFLSKGHKVHLIQSHRKGINPDLPDSLQGVSGLTYDIVTRKVINKNNFVHRYLNDMHYAFQAMKCWRKVKDADVIYLQSNPTAIYTIILLRIFAKIPIVYSIYDVFPGHAYDIGVIKNKVLFQALRLWQKPCYKLVDRMIVLSQDMKRKVMAEGAKKEKIYIVPAWFDPGTTYEVPKNENRFIKKYEISDTYFYVQFAGTIGYVFDYKAVIELASRLQCEPNIRLQMIGDGGVKNKFVSEVKERNLQNIDFYPLQPVEIVRDVYSACDICLIPLKKGVIGNGVPSKVPILMACKRVIVSSVETDSDYARMFRKYNMGVAVNYDDYDELAKEILRLYHSPEEMRKIANNAYRFGKKYYSSDVCVEKLLSALTFTN